MMKLRGFCSVTFWQNRVAEEKIKKAIELMNDAQTLNWQSINIFDVSKEVQRKMLADLKEQMFSVGFEKSWEEYKYNLTIEEND